MRTALGLRAHSGWAAMVAVAGTLDEPRVLHRQRLIIADPELPGSKQPYHFVAGLPLAQSEAELEIRIASSRALAVEAISASIKALASKHHPVTVCGLVLGSSRTLPPLPAILASHALIHTAEGQLFRDVLAWAAQQCSLEITGVAEKEIDAKSIQRLEGLGKLIGPPWTQDQKFAAFAALKALLNS